MPFQVQRDGSLDLYFQSDSPGKDKEANWLPAPKTPFNLTMRLYSPQADALTGKWNPPPIKKDRDGPAAGDALAWFDVCLSVLLQFRSSAVSECTIAQQGKCLPANSL